MRSSEKPGVHPDREGPLYSFQLPAPSSQPLETVRPFSVRMILVERQTITAGIEAVYLTG